MIRKIEKELVVTGQMITAHSPEAVWPLLCPVREYDWIEPWECEMVHTKSGLNELGCVFRTDLPGEGGTETWVTSRFDPFERIEFVRTNAWRTIRLVIQLEANDNGTVLTWTQHVTPLNAEGEAYLQTKPAAFAGQVTVLESMLNHYLDTGTMLRVSGFHPQDIKE